jgi:hypothetical protein
VERIDAPRAPLSPGVRYIFGLWFLPLRDEDTQIRRFQPTETRTRSCGGPGRGGPLERGPQPTGSGRCRIQCRISVTAPRTSSQSVTPATSETAVVTRSVAAGDTR